MTLYLDLETALLIADRATGDNAQVADYGLLVSSLARPQATVFGEEAYPSVFGKSAALLHSLAKNHCLVDENKRLAWLAALVLCHINGSYVDAPDDEAYDLVIAVADGSLSDVALIAQRLEQWSRPVAT